MHLQRIRSQLQRPLGQPALDHRDQQVGTRLPEFGISTGFLMRLVETEAADQKQRAHRLDLAAHRRQQPQHIGVMDDGVALLTLQRRALHAVAGIGDGLLIGAVRHGKPLQAHIETCRVHHQEHAVEAAVLLAQQVADGALVLTILQHRRRRGLDPHLLFDRQAMHLVPLADAAILVDEEFRHDEQRYAFHARRRVGKAGQHQMNDILAHVVLAIGDVDLLATNAVVIALRGRRGAERGEVCSGLRFGQVHRAGPFTGIQLRQICCLLLVAADHLERMDRALGQKLAEREAHIRAVPHLVDGGADALRQSLPAIFGIGVEPDPAAFRHRLPGIGKAVRCGDAAVGVAHRSGHVAGMVERRDHLAGELARLVENGIDKVLRDHVIPVQCRHPVQPDKMAKYEFHVVNRCLIHCSISR